MKRIICLILCLVFLFDLPLHANQKSVYYSEEEMHQTLNSLEEFESIYNIKNENLFSKQVWQKNGLLVTKTNANKPTIISKNVIKLGKTKELTNEGEREKRYLGTTPEGYVVENPDFPANAYNGKPFSEFNWQKNENIETSLKNKLRKLSESERRETEDFYWNLIEYSFTREYGHHYDAKNITPEMKERILNSAILVYPISESTRRLLSFRNKGNNLKEYEVTASIERGFKIPPPEVITTEESIPSLPIATQSKGNTLLIGSNQPGAEIFDVKKGIPGSETLYVNLLGDDFIAGYSYVTHVFTTTTKNKQRDPITKKFVMVESQETHSYKEITNAYVYAIKKAEVHSKALDKGKVTLEPKQGYGVTVSMSQGTEVGYKDAVLTINGVDITAGENITHNQTIASDTLYQDGIIIPNATPNVKDSQTTGKIYYELVFAYGNQNYAKERAVTFGGSPVTVHTPAVCYPSITYRKLKSNEIYHQKVADNPVFLKEETITVSYPTTGKHLDIPGYGDRDYAKYIGARQINFSFPVYEGTDYNGKYIPAYTWVDYPAGDETTYFIPSWAEEDAEHRVMFRSLPINLTNKNDKNYEMNANLDLKNYKAVEKIAVSVFGKFEGIKAFSTEDTTHKENLTLPIQPKAGKVKKRLDGVRLGFPVDFLVKTNADLFDKDDTIKIIPHYYFVDKKGKKTEVDVYYSGSKTFKKISQANDVVGQRARLKEWSDYLKEEHISSTAKILDNQGRNTGLDAEGYRDALLGDKYTNLGDNSELALGERLKLYHGIDLAKKITKPVTVSKEEIEKSKQSWYVRFFLPNESYVVPKGTDLKKLGGFKVTQAPFLHGGYILVNLEWQIYKDGELFMSYFTEPQSVPSTPYKAGLGDSILYDSERRASHLLN